MRFMPYHLLGDTPNVIVDGMSSKATICNLSHWPQSGTKKELKDDLSAQIVFHYLDRPDLHVEVEAVSNDHFDADGLIGLYSILNATEAQKDRELLIDVANAGDFGKYRIRQAARIAFVITAFGDKDRSPLDKGIFNLPYPGYTSAMYETMLPMLPEIIKDTEKFRRYWEGDEAFLLASEAAIRSGQVRIDEVKEIDLAVVTLPPLSAADNLGQGLNGACHQMAIHNATDCFRILLMRGNRYELYYRYESWVQYMSRRPMPRVDLSALAQSLSDQENGNGEWKFTDVEAMEPSLRLHGASDSKILPADFRKQVQSFLGEAPPAWDPYDQ
jgi:hypothetical protein